MSVRLYNTTSIVSYGEEMHLDNKTGCDTFDELVDLAQDLEDDGKLWYAVGSDWSEWLEFSYEMADAMLAMLKGQNKKNLQQIIDEAKQWGNYCVRLELR